MARCCNLPPAPANPGLGRATIRVPGGPGGRKYPREPLPAPPRRLDRGAGTFQPSPDGRCRRGRPGDTAGRGRHRRHLPPRGGPGGAGWGRRRLHGARPGGGVHTRGQSSTGHPGTRAAARTGQGRRAPEPGRGRPRRQPGRPRRFWPVAAQGLGRRRPRPVRPGGARHRLHAGRLRLLCRAAVRPHLLGHFPVRPLTAPGADRRFPHRQGDVGPVQQRRRVRQKPGQAWHYVGAFSPGSCPTNVPSSVSAAWGLCSVGFLEGVLSPSPGRPI